MRRARIAFLGIAGLAVLAGLAFLVVRRATHSRSPGHTDPAAASSGSSLSPGLDLEGVVLHGDAPVPGATVLVTSDEDGDAFSSARCPNEEDRSILDCPCAAVPDLAAWRFAEGRGEAEPIIETTTEEDGTFALTGLSPGRYAVWAEAGELAAVALDVQAGGSAELVLGPGVWYAGTARDEEGVAIEGALVAAVHTEHSRFFAVLTDPDGGFLLGPLPEGPYVVLASADGRVPVLDRAPSGAMDLALVPAGVVEGTVVRDGRPVVGAEVRTVVGCSPLVAATDAQGRFVLDGLLPERAAVAAFAGEDGGVEEVDLTAQDREGLVIALRRGGVIAGEVRDEAGAPVVAARVAVEGEVIETAAVTDEDGRFRASGLPPARYEVWLFPPAGFVPPARRSISVVAGQEARASYRLLGAARLAGLVEDEEGWPVPGAIILARRAREGVVPSGDGDAPLDVETRTDREGRFALEHVAPGPVHLRIDANGFLPAEVDARTPGELTVKLRRGGSLELEIVDEADLGVTGALLRLSSARPQAGETVRREAAADARGWFRFDGLPHGRYRVVAQLRSPARSDRRWSRTVTAGASVTPGETTKLTLRLEGGLSIAGKVVEEGSGRPLAGVEVEAADEIDDSAADMGEGRPPRAGGAAITDREGRFEIRHLRPNRHRLSWSLHEYQASEAARPTRPGEIGLVLTMRRLAPETAAPARE